MRPSYLCIRVVSPEDQAKKLRMLRGIDPDMKIKTYRMLEQEMRANWSWENEELLEDIKNLVYKKQTEDTMRDFFTDLVSLGQKYLPPSSQPEFRCVHPREEEPQPPISRPCSPEPFPYFPEKGGTFSEDEEDFPPKRFREQSPRRFPERSPRRFRG